MKFYIRQPPMGDELHVDSSIKQQKVLQWFV